MEIKDLTPEIVTPIIRELVAQFGADYVYKAEEHVTTRGCVYQENGKPSCIVGHVLDRTGVAYDPDWDSFSLTAKMVLSGADARVRRGLDYAQGYQDMRYPWGEALAAYEEEVGA